jgi:hypothetical protein
MGIFRWRIVLLIVSLAASALSKSARVLTFCPGDIHRISLRCAAVRGLTDEGEKDGDEIYGIPECVRISLSGFKELNRYLQTERPRTNPRARQ